MAERYEIIIDFKDLKGSQGPAGQRRRRERQRLRPHRQDHAVRGGQGVTASTATQWPTVLGAPHPVMALKAADRKAVRSMRLHRSNGMWKINDTTWDDVVKSNYEHDLRQPPARRHRDLGRHERLRRLVPPAAHPPDRLQGAQPHHQRGRQPPARGEGPQGRRLRRRERDRPSAHALRARGRALHDPLPQPLARGPRHDVPVHGGTSRHRLRLDQQRPAQAAARPGLHPSCRRRPAHAAGPAPATAAPETTSPPGARRRLPAPPRRFPTTPAPPPERSPRRTRGTTHPAGDRHHDGRPGGTPERGGDPPERTRSRRPPGPGRRPCPAGCWSAALGAGAAGGLHVAVAVDHLEAGELAVGFFLLTAFAQLGLAGLAAGEQLRPAPRPDRRLVSLALLATVALIGLYVVAYTTGLLDAFAVHDSSAHSGGAHGGAEPRSRDRSRDRGRLLRRHRDPVRRAGRHGRRGRPRPARTRDPRPGRPSPPRLLLIAALAALQPATWRRRTVNGLLGLGGLAWALWFTGVLA